YKTTGYLIQGKKTIIIETGAAPSNKVILSALEELGIALDKIDAIAVTHIHLDHSGGAGLLMSQCPNAVLLAHEKAKRHLADPEKLTLGARQVYGDAFNSLFNPILPIHEDRIEIMKDEDAFDLGEDRVLKFYNSPGHAFHHFLIHDPKSKGIFAGDSAGLFYDRIYKEHGIKISIPVTSPPQFAPELMIETIDKMISLNPERIYYTHFGMSDSAIELLYQAKEWVSFFSDECVEFCKQDRSLENLTDYIQEQVLVRLEKMGIPPTLSDKENLRHDNWLNAQGIIAYVARMEKSG
ncbi:MBL fold metallo-hydrolase, partial [bacterium]|nr:MBL fold metallo-hydrolase [bacterium]